MTSSKTDTRLTVVRVLPVMAFDSKAVTAAEQTLNDSDPETRPAAAVALGVLKSKGSIPDLRVALKDKSGSVVLTAAKSLTTLGDEAGYEVYYAIVTGQRKSGPRTRKTTSG